MMVCWCVLKRKQKSEKAEHEMTGTYKPLRVCELDRRAN